MNSPDHALAWPSISVQKASRWIADHWRLVLLSFMVLVLYAQVLTGLMRQWSYDANYSHGWLVPIFSGYLIWRNRQVLPSFRREPSLLGLFVLLSSLGLLFVGQWGAELFLTRISLWGTILGLVLYFLGWSALRQFAFPLCFLLLMIPLPALIHNQIVFPLQLLASRLATACLEGVDVVPVLREGNLLILPNYTIQVVEACSGIRSLFSLLALGLGYSYLAERSMAMRALLVLAMVPLAIASNGVRVVGAALLTNYWGARAAEGFFHSFSGWAIFMVATVLLLILHAGLLSLRRALHRATPR